jgi:hypothetical protein
MNPARMFLESLDRRPGIREPPLKFRLLALANSHVRFRGFSLPPNCCPSYCRRRRIGLQADLPLPTQPPPWLPLWEQPTVRQLLMPPALRAADYGVG